MNGSVRTDEPSYFLNFSQGDNLRQSTVPVRQYRAPIYRSARLAAVFCLRQQ